MGIFLPLFVPFLCTPCCCTFCDFASLWKCLSCGNISSLENSTIFPAIFVNLLRLFDIFSTSEIKKYKYILPKILCVQPKNIRDFSHRMNRLKYKNTYINPKYILIRRIYCTFNNIYVKI